jgi:hypothetical protein
LDSKLNKIHFMFDNPLNDTLMNDDLTILMWDVIEAVRNSVVGSMNQSYTLSRLNDVKDIYHIHR